MQSKFIVLQCESCGKKFERRYHHYNKNLKNGVKNVVCSRKCATEVTRRSLEVTCSHCLKVFKKQQSRVKNSSNHFCSLSCNAIFQNSKKPKRAASPKLKRVKLSDITKGELFNKRKNWQSARSAIQKLARQAYKASDKPQECLMCHYSKHFEVCHIRDVSSFSDDAFIAEINHLDNLMALCPTHHWEFDNNHLSTVMVDPPPLETSK